INIFPSSPLEFWPGGRYRFTFNCKATSANSRFTFAVDGTSICDSGSTSGDGLGAPIGSVFKASRTVDITSGFHQVAVQWRATSGTVDIDTTGLLQFNVTKISET